MATQTYKFGTYDLGADDNPESVRSEIRVRLGQIEIPRKDGGVLLASPFLAPRPITLKGSLSAATQELARTARDTLRQKFAGGARQKFREFDDRYMYASVQRLEDWWEQGMFSLGWMAELLADDPFWEADAVTTKTPVTGTSGAFGSNVACPNAGTAYTWPVFTITVSGGTLTTLTVENDTSGDSISWAGSLAAAKVLVINCGAQTITEDGTETMANLSAGDFWSLAANASGHNVKAKANLNTHDVVVTYQERWF